MMERLTRITEGICAVENVTINKGFEADSDGTLRGSITVLESGHSLQFEVEIFEAYPFQFHDVETIRFINNDLIEYNHVNSDGSICVHTPHNRDLKSKVFYDINSLKEWIVKYYINKEEDHHYDHIMVTESASKAHSSCFLFTNVSIQFAKNDFGYMYVSLLSKGMYINKPVFTYIVQSFRTNKLNVPCKWSKFYSALSYQKGVYFFMEHPPVHNRRFIVENWNDLQPYVSQEFMKFLYGVKKDNDFNKKGITELPLFIGYKIPAGETHWQCALIKITDFPFYSEKSNGTYTGHFSNVLINWAQTKNCSREYFFGRGSLCEAITQKRILVIGIGAVGSMVATTLARGGCISISLADHDIKEPENVCRSEYFFNTGLNSKVQELKRTLLQISPFIDVSAFSEFMDSVKLYINDDKYKGKIKAAIEKYDLIIDCTADNDVAYILETLAIESELINLSITNHASELVCVVKPNLYDTLMHLSESLDPDKTDLYNPTGCWSPTFKASYNDISLVVQFALKHLNSAYKNGDQLRSFYVKFRDTDLKLHQF